ncbi:MAG: YceI family protein [Candidatus Korobacteraceae bacterium]
MLKHIAILAIAVILVLGVVGLSGVSAKPATTAGSWQVDTRHSAVQLITDGTTDYGKTKMDFTLGFGRVNGNMMIDDADPTKSSVVFRFYPAAGMGPAIAENGKFLSQWLMNVANHTLVSFHSKTVQRTPDGKLQATGDLTITRVDRNVELDPTEAYSGPTYGPPMVHRVAREATFVFDLSPADGNGVIEASTSTSVGRENFPQLVKAVVGTYWPPVVQDEDCQNPTGASEAYRGFKCTGTFMEAAGLPPAPGTQVAEDYAGAPSNFNSVVGNRLNIALHMRLMAKASAEPMGAGN